MPNSNSHLNFFKKETRIRRGRRRRRKRRKRRRERRRGRRGRRRRRRNGRGGERGRGGRSGGGRKSRQCDGLNNGPPKVRHIPSPRTCEYVTFLGRKDFADVIK